MESPGAAPRASPTSLSRFFSDSSSLSDSNEGNFIENYNKNTGRCMKIKTLRRNISRPLFSEKFLRSIKLETEISVVVVCRIMSLHSTWTALLDFQRVNCAMDNGFLKRKFKNYINKNFASITLFY